jgi:predicted site-specific integrase-resolvase
MKTYSTKQIARIIGVHWVTLHRWLAAKKIKAGIGIPIDGQTLWRWTEKDLKQVRKYKEANYRKGRGRKQKPQE